MLCHVGAQTVGGNLRGPEPRKCDSFNCYYYYYYNCYYFYYYYYYYYYYCPESATVSRFRLAEECGFAKALGACHGRIESSRQCFCIAVVDRDI